MPVKTMIEAVQEAIRQEMERDSRVMVLGEDVGRKGGVFGATRGLFEKFGGERVLDTPLAESAIVGSAIGMALNGLRPVAEIQFADFIWPAANQIISEAARIRYRSNNTFSVPMVIRAPYGAGIHGGLYHSQSIEAFFAHVPGLVVITPSSPYDTKGLLMAAIRSDDPVLFLEHKKTYRMLREEVPEAPYTVPIGTAKIVREGRDLSVFSYGLSLLYAREAADTLAQEGIDTEVVDLRTLRPLDTATILQSVRKTGKALILHEDTQFGGFGAEVAAVIAQGAFEYLDAPVMRQGGPEAPAAPFSKPLEEWWMPSPAKIADAMRELAEY
ncbi:MAG: alpha-ketoacid dehydrogenase subunit beta [Anaerolineae bacterium]|nr:alpha-ketoacid dehydrogenase subunit beta [Anaerolineae bacterium]